MEAKKVLIIEDEKDLGHILNKVIADRYYKVNTALSGKEGIRKFKAHKPDCVILDLKLPDMDGVKVLYRIKGFDSKVKIIFITAYGTKDIKEELFKIGIADFIEKPFRIERILKALKKAMN